MNKKSVFLNQLGEYKNAIVRSIGNCMSDGECEHCVALDLQEKIYNIHTDNALRDRMFAMGIVPGACVQKMGDCPLKDPIIVRVSGHCVSLRKEEASLILVETDL